MDLGQATIIEDLSMNTNIECQLQQLQQLTTAQLRQRYWETFGQAARSSNKSWLIKRIAWRLQTLAEGGICERARQRATDLACAADLRLGPPRAGSRSASITLPQRPAVVPAARDPRLPPAGSLLTRWYKGQSIEVKVLEHGFDYQGRAFSSLSALAKQITGSHCSGFSFFGLGRRAQGDDA